MNLKVIIHVFETGNISLVPITAYNILGELLTLLIDSNDFSGVQLGLIFVTKYFVIMIERYNYHPIICECLDDLRQMYMMY